MKDERKESRYEAFLLSEGTWERLEIITAKGRKNAVQMLLAMQRGLTSKGGTWKVRKFD